MLAPTGRKPGAPSLETLQGVRRAMANEIRAMRRGNRKTQFGKRIVDALYRLAQVIEIQREMGLAAIPDAELEAEIERRAEQRASAGAEAAPVQ